MARKIKIACVLQMFGIGGMPKWLFALARELKDEFEFTFIATHSKIFVPEYRQVARVIKLPFNKLALAAFFRFLNPDIVQVANLRLYTEAALLAGTCVIVERVDGVRSGVAFQDKAGLDAVIASTRGIVNPLSKLIPPEKIHVIYNGVDIRRYDNAPPQRFGFQQSDVIIGRTSRLAGGKNISLLIKAVIELRKEQHFKNVRLVVCGGDTSQPGAVPMMDRLKKEAGPLGESAVFTGEVLDTAQITKGFDIATCTSRPNNEGIPNSLIEAMAAAKPVIASKVDDIPELVDDGRTGILFTENNIDELIAGLKRLVDDAELRHQMGTKGREKVVEQFNLSIQSRKYADLYHKLIKDSV